MDEQFITHEMLDEIGVDLTNTDKDALLVRLNTTLEERIGDEITGLLTDTQLQELLDVQDSGDDDAVNRWIEQAVPNFENIISTQVADLLVELADEKAAYNQRSE